MNASRNLIRQTRSACLAVRGIATKQSHSLQTFSAKLQQSSLKQLPPCLASLSHLRQMSTAQSSKFEVINIQDEDDFKKRVLDNSLPVVVDFHANWCGPCKLLGPRLEKLLSEAKGQVVMAKVDIDENSELAMEYGVRSVPTVLGMKNGKVLNQFVGLIDEDKIETFIDKLVIS